MQPFFFSFKYFQSVVGWLFRTGVLAMGTYLHVFKLNLQLTLCHSGLAFIWFGFISICFNICERSRIRIIFSLWLCAFVAFQTLKYKIKTPAGSLDNCCILYSIFSCIWIYINLNSNINKTKFNVFNLNLTICLLSCVVHFSAYIWIW